jgi:hypothetical protein
MRGWSNGDIRLPNRGEQFAILTIRLNAGRVGGRRGGQDAIDRSFNLARSPAANGFGSEKGLLP